ILGDSDFVDRILESADEEMERRVRYCQQGVDLDKLAEIVAEGLGVSPAEFEAPGRQPHRVQARSLYCYWAARELGTTTTTLAKRFKLTQPAISLAVSRGERLVAEKGWRLHDCLG
ncbi:MAG: transposase, partial [Geobacteraceae bacterium]|nr:transposase [Geobacteraceae bacterium]